MTSRLIDITGMTFGRTVALEKSHRQSGQTLWRCRCSCGNEHFASGSTLRSGRVKSCGCLTRERTLIRNTKHGAAHRGHNNRLYWVWAAMRRRCSDREHKDYELYGARGVKVCARWDDFAAFAGDVGPRPPGMTLDRIDVDGDYEPGNVRWATWREQRMNQRRMKGAA